MVLNPFGFPVPRRGQDTLTTPMRGTSVLYWQQRLVSWCRSNASHCTEYTVWSPFVHKQCTKVLLMDEWRALWTLWSDRGVTSKPRLSKVSLSLNLLPLEIEHSAHGLHLLLAASLSCSGTIARLNSFNISSIRAALLFHFALSLGARPFVYLSI